MTTYPFDLKPLSADEYAKAQADFNRIDKDGNGQLDAKELTNYLTQYKPELRSFPRLIIHIFGDGKTIDWSRFYYCYRSFSASPDDDENYIGRKIFEYIDSDKSGEIDSNEFNQILDYIDAPRGQIHPLRSVGSLTYPDFKKKFYELLKMIWRSSGYQ